MTRGLAVLLSIGLLSGCIHRTTPTDPLVRCVGGLHYNEPEPTDAQVQRDARFSSDFAEGRVRVVELEMLGCFGHCPRYRVSFEHGGEALFTAARCHARSHVPFERVLQAISSAVGMRPSYGSEANDAFGARVRIVTVDDTIESTGIDIGTWGPELLVTWARIDQLVHDTNWTPALITPACVHALGGVRPRG